MCIQIKFDSPFPNFQSLYSQIDFSKIGPQAIALPSIPDVSLPDLTKLSLFDFKVPAFTVPTPLYPNINTPAINFNFFITDIQNFNLLVILNKFLSKMLRFLGLGFDFLPKMPILNIGFSEFIKFVFGNINGLYQLGISKSKEILARFPKMFNGFNIPELEIVSYIRMMIADYMTVINTFACNIVNLVVNKVKKVFRVGLPVFQFPTIPDLNTIMNLLKSSFAQFVDKLPGIPTNFALPAIPELPPLPKFNLPTVPSLTIPEVPNLNDPRLSRIPNIDKLENFKIPSFDVDFANLDLKSVTEKIFSLEYFIKEFKIPTFKFPEFPDVYNMFAQFIPPEQGMFEKLIKLSNELSTFLLRKATTFFNRILGRFLGGLPLKVPSFSIPCPDSVAASLPSFPTNPFTVGPGNSTLNTINTNINNSTQTAIT